MGDRIRRLRKSREWKQDALAREVGVKRLAVVKWETEGHAPSAANLVKLASTFGVTVEYLAHGEGGRYRQAVEEIRDVVRRALEAPPLKAPEALAEEGETALDDDGGGGATGKAAS